MSLKKIKRAIISVSDKSNLKLILPILKKYNVEILSSAGTFKKIKSMNYKCNEISNYTGFSEILDGRVKTLHPKIYAGILGIRKDKKHKKDLIKQNIKSIDLVIVDLYPFEDKLKKEAKFEKIIEQIDIGGSSLIRAAAKNFNDVTIISNIDDYSKLIKQLNLNKGKTSIEFRKQMSAKAFNLTAYYDSVISNWFNDKVNIKFPEKKTIHGKLIENLRYGENPHQEGKLYLHKNNLGLKKLHGKKLSYNNYNDIYSGLEIINSLKKNEGVVIIKHANPCGVSSEKNQFMSFKNALMCDPVSAYGGVVAVNSIVSKKLAQELNKVFFEVIIAKGFGKDSLKILKKRKNVRLVDFSQFKLINNKHYQFLGNHFLAQDLNNIILNKKLKIVTKKKPTLKQVRSLKFAFAICKFVKSNAIVLVNNKSTIGIGSGQPSRLDSCKIASGKALHFIPEKIINSVAASDAFFPFVDGVEELTKVGVNAIIQPGGSVNDKKVINAANKAGIVMAFTSTRHFKH
ncbi:bifunctional phosphoribosylaminoimidazolecarboxamide formyltransferase/IMP cyclohydrolase [Pelagibacteraceae bacterium]|jgi:phosphoribosylaminoimidazolecarboxamide formyltransferase / IMP cyclohydrolase|nr:bifunctional phosphoribosylaminoimidazolecarboxamide formyltransferase/IMP cyclohydrolase [Pelagibacteraceae bacterium]